MTRAVTITTLNTPKNKPNQLTSECFCSFGNDWEGPDLNLHPTSNENSNYFHPSGSTISLLCSNSSTCTCTLVRTLALVAEGFQKFCELMSLSKNTSICKMPHANSKCAMALLQNVDTVLFRENNMNTQQKKHVQNVGTTKLLRPDGFLDWNTVSRIFWLWHFSDRHATEHLPEFRSSKEVQEARCSGQCIAHRGVAWRRRLGPVRLLAWSSRCVLARRIACPALGTAAREMRGLPVSRDPGYPFEVPPSGLPSFGTYSIDWRSGWRMSPSSRILGQASLLWSAAGQRLKLDRHKSSKCPWTHRWKQVHHWLRSWLTGWNQQLQPVATATPRN